MKTSLIVAASLAVVFYAQVDSGSAAEQCVKATFKNGMLCADVPQPPRQSTPRPPRVVKEKTGTVCVTGCLTNSEWANCTTKSWYASGMQNLGRPTTPRFTAQCGTVCRPAGHATMWYKTSTGRQVVFSFGGPGTP